jgi:hypothetical protein
VTVDVWADSVQTAAVVVGAAALAYAGRQARPARHGGGGANVLQLWSFLQGGGARANRRALYRAHERAGLFEASEMNWSEDELDAAGHVAQVWSVTGRLVKEDLVPGRLVLEEWGGTIRRNRALAPWARRHAPRPPGRACAPALRRRASRPPATVLR